MSEQSQAAIDKEILRLSRSGLSQAQIAHTLTREGTSIAQTTVGRRLKVMGEPSLGKGTPNGLTPVKKVVLSRLIEAGHPLEPDDFQGSGGVVGGQLTATLHALRKAGYVTLVETSSASNRNGHHQSVKKVEITDKGRDVLKPAVTPIPGEPTTNAYSHSLGALPSKAPGGPIERFPGHAVIRDEVKQEPLVAYLAEPISTSVIVRPPHHDERPDDETAYTSAVPEPLDIVEDRTEEQKAADGDLDTPVWHEAPVWPALSRLRERTAKVHAAARLLEEAGLDDAAIAALDALKFTDLEREYLAFADACDGR